MTLIDLSQARSGGLPRFEGSPHPRRVIDPLQ
jgi:hypothetical protein